MNDNTIIHYVDTMVQCSDPTVTSEAPYGDDQMSPASLINYWKSAGYKVFRNKEGTHIVAINRYYTGTIDGKSMSSYATGQVYTDVFKEGFILPSPTPDCKGGDFNSPPNEFCAGSTVNLGTGRLSHAQEVFTLNNSRILALGVTLNYRSIPFAPSNIGNGWSHNYESTLVAGSGTSMVLWIDGTRRVYEKYGSSYVSPKRDYSALVKNGDNTWTITELNGLKRNFDSTGKLTSLTDRYTNTLSFAYNGSNGKLSSVTDSTGRAITFGYNASSGKLETITDPKQNVHTLGYTGTNLTSVTPPGNKGQWVYTYNAQSGLLETKTDPEHNLVSYTYYSDKRLKDTTDPLTKTRSYSYPSSTGSPGKIPDPYNVILVPLKNFKFTEKDTNLWQYAFDTSTMAVRSATDPNGKTTTNYYNADGTLRAKTTPFDGTVKVTTFYTYDSRGNVLTETDPVDISTYTPAIDPQTVDIASLASKNPPIKSAFIYTYDSANYYDIKTVTDNRGSTALTTTYDRYTESDGNGGTWLVTRITSPGETTGTTLVKYVRQNQNGTLARTTDANGKTTIFAYYPVDATNSSGLLQSLTAPSGVKISYTAYDKNGNATEFKLNDADGVEIPTKTTQGYNALNQLTSLLKESTSQPAAFSTLATQFDYDNNGNLSTIVDPESRMTTYKYTYQGQLSEILDATRVNTTKFEYSGCSTCGSGVDKLSAVKDARHVANNQSGTIFTYDKAGRLETETDPIGKKYRYTYYDSGLLKEKIDATSTTEKVLITHLYNKRGQLADKLYSNNTSVHFTYDANARLETASNLTGTTTTFSYTYTYHQNGRLKTVTDSSGRQIRYDEYDANGQRKKVTLFPSTTDQRIVTYDYDSANRPWNIYAPAGTFTYTYDERNRRKKLAYPNGTQADYGYDDLDRLTSLNHSIAGGSTFVANGYTEFDKLGNIKTRTGTAPATYSYDSLYRLTDATTGNTTENYTYDAVGNRTSGPGSKDTLSTYSHNAANQMEKGRTLTFGYDNAGNQTMRSIDNAPEKTWKLTWDDENRLISLDRSKGAETRSTTFKYDPFGRRIEKKHVTVINGVTRTTTTTYFYDEEDIAFETVSDGTSTTNTYYTHGPGADEPLALERNGQFYFYHADHLGSVMAITDVTKGIVQSYAYDSFGAPNGSSTFTNSYLFTGREWDKELGLYFYRARYYDPIEGRLVSKDPIGFSGGDFNIYSYVRQNPTNLVDPSGEVVQAVLIFCEANPPACAAAAAATAAAVMTLFKNPPKVPPAPNNDGGKACTPSLEDMKNNPPTHPDYTPPKKFDGNKRKNPNGPGSGWPDKNGDTWVPTDHNGTHAPHYDVQTPGGGYKTKYP